jgi:hypothetical protein
MKLSAILEPLLSAKADHELIRAQILAFEAEQNNALERRREHERDRQARKREKDALSRDVTLRHSDRPLAGAGDVRVEDKTSTLKVVEQEARKDSKAPAKPSPRQRLETVLDPERAEAVLDHRQRLRKPLTEHAAKMLAAEFAKFPDPNAAADRMVAKGWLSIEASWAESGEISEQDRRPLNRGRHRWRMWRGFTVKGQQMDGNRDMRIAAALERLFLTYPQSDRGDEMAIARERIARFGVYLEALEPYVVEDIEAAVHSFLTGKAPGVNAAFLPPAPQLAAEAKRLANLRYESEERSRRMRPALPRPISSTARKAEPVSKR